MEKKNKLVLTGLLLVALIMFCLPTYGYAAMHQADTELFTDFSDVTEEEIYNLKKDSSAKELVSEIMKLEESLPTMDEKIAIVPHLTALIDMDNEFSAAELITLIEDEDTDVGLDSAFIKMYVNNGYDVSNLLPLLNDDGIAQEAKEYIVALGNFSSSELSSIYTSHDDSIAVIAMKRIAVIDDQLAFELAASVLSSDNNMVTDEKYIAAFLGVAEYYENHCDDATRDVALVRTREQFVPIMKDLYDTSSNELLKDQAVYAMSRIGNYDLFTYIIESENIDFDLKVSTIERNVDLMVEQVSTTTSLQEIDTIIAAMRLHPIIEVGEALEIAATEGSLASTRGRSEIYDIISFIEKNGIEGVNKSETDAHVAGLGHADEVDTHSVGIGAWKGYAVYRDGVLGNINDHAALMDEDNISHAMPVIQATGYGETVNWVSWDKFLGEQTYLGLFKPYGCTITSARADSFIAKARELRGISYNVLDQIVYSAGDSTWVRPEHISHLRCDGVVEYTYEWYGWRVGGPDDEWDITRNLTANYWEHSGIAITPRLQNEELLEFVSSSVPY